MTSQPWISALKARTVWVRALTIGVPVGGLQIVVNQGDVLLHGPVTQTVIIKTILTPLIAVAVCLISAASTYRPLANKPISGPISHVLPRS